jgi:transketolase
MSNDPIRIIFGKEVIRLAGEYEYIAVCADTKCCNFEYFGDSYPERQVSIGIAEQNLIGVAAGLASCGHKVVLATYSVFATMRACEQLRTYICHPMHDVMVMGTHGGLQTGSEGVSHTAIEDLAVLRAIPNMTIIQPSDGVSARVLARKAMDFHGPLYVRLPFDAVEDINDESNYCIEIGKANWVKRTGSDVTLIATGIMLDRTIKAAAELEKQGIQAQVMEIHTLKPIDREAIIQAASETGAIVTVEDHSIIGGLGGAVAEVLSTTLPTPMRMIGIQDCFARSGDADALYKLNRMTLEDIVAAATELVKGKT